MNLKLLVKSDMLGRVEYIEHNNKILMSRIQLEKGVYSLINPKELYINDDLTFNELKEIRKFIKQNKKEFYSLFNEIDIIPYKNEGLLISYKSYRKIIKH